jgi:hypothetical protein
MESIPRFPPPSQPSPEEQAEALDATASELNYLTTTAADTTQSEEYRKRELDPISESFAAAASSRQSHHHRSSSSATVNPPTTSARINPHAPLQSPCFVHSHLDNSLSFGRRQEERRQRSKSRNRGEGRRGKGGYSSDEEDGGGEGGKRNVTQVLAETASSVREMSKQLGTVLSLLVHSGLTLMVAHLGVRYARKSDSERRYQIDHDCDQGEG